ALGQPILIENRPGAGGLIAGDYVARSAPDGHTLFVGSNASILLGPMTMPKPPYQWDKVFAPVSSLAVATNMLLVTPKLPGKTVTELVDYAKKNPGKLTLATSSGASINHFLAELLTPKTGITWPEVHCITFNGLFAPKDTPPAVIDKLSAAIRTALEKKEVVAKLGDLGSEARGSKPQEFTKFLADETAKWADVMQKANIKVQSE